MMELEIQLTGPVLWPTWELHLSGIELTMYRVRFVQAWASPSQWKHPNEQLCLPLRFGAAKVAAKILEIHLLRSQMHTRL